MFLHCLEMSRDFNASDIHFEPGLDSLNVKIRVNGYLHQIKRIEKYHKENFIQIVLQNAMIGNL